MAKLTVEDFKEMVRDSIVYELGAGFVRKERYLGLAIHGDRSYVVTATGSTLISSCAFYSDRKDAIQAAKDLKVKRLDRELMLLNARADSLVKEIQEVSRGMPSFNDYSECNTNDAADHILEEYGV